MGSCSEPLSAATTTNQGGAGFFETESSNLWLPKEPPAWGLRRQDRETQEDLLPEARTGWRVKEHAPCPEVHMLLYSQPFLSPGGSLTAQCFSVTDF